MRVLLTSILCKSGLLTHVIDLARQLVASGIQVSLAVPSNDPYFEATKHYLHDLTDIPVNLYGSAKQLLDNVRANPIDLIHAHSPNILGDSFLVSKHLGIPLIMTLHGVYEWERQFPEVLQYADHIIAVGPAQVIAKPRYLQKTSVIPNGVDLNRFHPPARTDSSEDPLQVIWYGRTHGIYSQGIKVLDVALGFMKANGKNIVCSKIGIASGVKTNTLIDHGWVHDPVPLLQKSHIAFGHGRAIREAMACGNVSYLLGYGYGGRIKTSWFSCGRGIVDAFPQYNLPLATTKTIMRDLSYLYDNKHLLSQFRHEARQIAENHFDIREMVDKTITVYKTVGHA